MFFRTAKRLIELEGRVAQLEAGRELLVLTVEDAARRASQALNSLRMREHRAAQAQNGAAPQEDTGELDAALRSRKGWR